MNPSPAGHVGWLDGWRGFALACVLIEHFGGPYFLGRFGVDAFFVLSGLLISRMLYEAQQPLPAFFWRRAARILPGFVGYVLIVYGAYAVMGISLPGRELLATLLFIRTYWPADASAWIDSPLPVAHLWSLNVEEHAYLWMACAALALRRQRKRAAWFLLACAAICLGFYAVYRFHPPATAMPYSGRTECAAFPIFLSAGLSLAGAEYGWRTPRWLGPSALALALVLGAVGALKMSIYLVAVPALLALALNAMWCLPQDATAPAPLLKSLFENAWLRRLGVASFSIYLWQQPAHTWLQRHQVPGPGVAWMLFSLALGSLMYRLLERPVRRWLVSRPWAPQAATPQR